MQQIVTFYYASNNIVCFGTESITGEYNGCMDKHILLFQPPSDVEGGGQRVAGGGGEQALLVSSVIITRTPTVLL